MTTLRSLLFWVVVVLTIVPWTLAVLLMATLRSHRAGWWTAVSWFRVVTISARWICGVRVQVRGVEHLRDVDAAVLLSKHQSAFETMLLPTLVPHPLAYVFKRELLRIPFFGWCMASLDMIHIDRSSRAQAMKEVLTQGQRLLSEGIWVILFPEGTRIPRGQSGTYQSAGARLAVQAGVPVLPVAVTSARCWPSESWRLQPGIVDVVFGAPMTNVDSEPRELMRAVEQWIEATMRELDSSAYC